MNMIDLIPRFRKKEIPALRTFKVPVYWEMWGVLTVKAHTKKEAMGFALSPEAPLPESSYYLERSVEIDRKGVEEYNIGSDDIFYDDEITDDAQSVEIFWDDLTTATQQKIMNMLGDNGNYDVFPIAEILKGEDEQ